MIKVGGIIGAFIQYVDVFIFNGAFVNGIWVNGSTANKVQIRGSVQEAEGKYLKMLPEGARDEETKVIFSQDSLPIDDADYNAGVNDIRFVIDNKTYRLISDKQWAADYSVYIVQLLRANNGIPTL